jgi:hypothetical protein
VPPTNADRSAQSNDRQLSSVDAVPDGLRAQAEYPGRLGDGQQLRAFFAAAVELSGSRWARGEELQARQEPGQCRGHTLMHVHWLLAPGAVEVMRVRVPVGEVGLAAALAAPPCRIASVVHALSLCAGSYRGLGLIG